MNFEGCRCFLGNRIEHAPLLRSSFRAFYTWLATASTYSVHIWLSRMATWSVQATTKLIELYEERPNLYNIKDKSYHNRDLRSKAYSEIATALDISGIIIQYIINSNYVLNF